MTTKAADIVTANKLADAVQIVDCNLCSEAVGSVVIGVDESNNQEAARVMVDGEPVTPWLAADAATVRLANEIIHERVFARNDELEGKSNS